MLVLQRMPLAGTFSLKPQWAQPGGHLVSLCSRWCGLRRRWPQGQPTMRQHVLYCAEPLFEGRCSSKQMWGAAGRVGGGGIGANCDEVSRGLGPVLQTVCRRAHKQWGQEVPCQQPVAPSELKGLSGRQAGALISGPKSG